ncbi:MAG: hypothetical protein CL840_14125 [Crocinitomicaceae bacterium]|nr:hypothetical protein [Crocinitomicaceae bacterium]|tara:strand:- start:712 stop:1527 length:816 start_codon:yes stop_codon:yes gene_type:complete
MNTFGLTMARKFFILLGVLILIISSCKKDEETKENTSNIDNAPADISQSFDIEVTIEANRVVEVVWKTGVTEFAKTTYRYTTDTIYETVYELSKRSFYKKHRLNDNQITSTIDSAYGKDTVDYFRLITYEYVNGRIDRMVVENHEIQDIITKVTTTKHDYLYKDSNLFEVSYDPGNVNDSIDCSDRYGHYSFESDVDVKNILGISEGSTSKNLKSRSAHLIGCNGNGSSGSTLYEYWYSINEDKRITEIVYRKTFNGTVQSFRENYKYIIR